ncbi:hypothetical protein P154DRAFT_148213 [Amniculicola lignicola CBS 123094]|uniref:Uncharacterized protein n=1 Tax=Amniculicola lignicola CBS 123094 TaxID=1392246 RepID=A0A6A5WLJ2_9PLEO|nr:hypothetical protein P154DRAFT_148213 [Amniculicola lignicola CBS 123094]
MIFLLQARLIQRKNYPSQVLGLVMLCEAAMQRFCRHSWPPSWIKRRECRSPAPSRVAAEGAQLSIRALGPILHVSMSIGAGQTTHPPRLKPLSRDQSANSFHQDNIDSCSSTPCQGSQWSHAEVANSKIFQNIFDQGQILTNVASRPRPPVRLVVPFL